MYNVLGRPDTLLARRQQARSKFFHPMEMRDCQIGGSVTFFRPFFSLEVGRCDSPCHELLRSPSGLIPEATPSIFGGAVLKEGLGGRGRETRALFTDS